MTKEKILDTIAQAIYDLENELNSENISQDERLILGHTYSTLLEIWELITK